MTIDYYIIVYIFTATLVFLMCYKILQAIKQHTKIKKLQTAEIERVKNAILKTQIELRALHVLMRNEATGYFFDTVTKELKAINDNLINTNNNIRKITQ